MKFNFNYGALAVVLGIFLSVFVYDRYTNLYEAHESLKSKMQMSAIAQTKTFSEYRNTIDNNLKDIAEKDSKIEYIQSRYFGLMSEHNSLKAATKYRLETSNKYKIKNKQLLEAVRRLSMEQAELKQQAESDKILINLLWKRAKMLETKLSIFYKYYTS